MYSEVGTVSDNLGKAKYTNDLFYERNEPAFVSWNSNTVNTPFKVGLTDCQEGFAFCYGKWNDYQTTVAFAKNSNKMWIYSKLTQEWTEYVTKSDLSSFWDVVTAEYTVTLSANQSTITSGSVTIKNGYTPLPKMLSVRTTGSDAVFASGDNYYENGKIYVYLKNTANAERTIKVTASMLCYKS